MKKKVNVYPERTINSIRNPIHTVMMNVELPVGDILKCLCSKAKVEEILSDGSLVRLNFRNYNKINEEVKPVKKFEAPKGVSNAKPVDAKPKEVTPNKQNVVNTPNTAKPVNTANTNNKPNNAAPQQNNNNQNGKK